MKKRKEKKEKAQMKTSENAWRDGGKSHSNEATAAHVPGMGRSWPLK